MVPNLLYSKKSNYNKSFPSSSQWKHLLAPKWLISSGMNRQIPEPGLIFMNVPHENSTDLLCTVQIEFSRLLFFIFCEGDFTKDLTDLGEKDLFTIIFEMTVNIFKIYM